MIDVYVYFKTGKALEYSFSDWNNLSKSVNEDIKHYLRNNRKFEIHIIPPEGERIVINYGY